MGANPRRPDRLSLLVERGCKGGEDLCPPFAGALGVVGPVRMELVGQGELAAIVERRDIDVDAAHVGGLPWRARAPGECKAARPIYLQVFAGVVDVLALAADEE